MQVTVTLTDEQISYLRLLDNKPGGIERTINYLVASVADGMRRPGAWERQVVNQLFNNDYQKDLVPNPEMPFYDIPKDKL